MVTVCALSGCGTGVGGVDRQSTDINGAAPSAGAALPDSTSGEDNVDAGAAGQAAESGDSNASDGNAAPGGTDGAGVGDGSSGSDGSDEDESSLENSEPVACDAATDAIAKRFLALVNSVRAEARYCGTEFYEAASTVGWDDRLVAAARHHSQDMAQHNFFSHTGSDGSSVSMRIDAAGYDWRAVGENIAAGQGSVREAVDSWVASPGHCRNLMNPAYEAVALACTLDESSDFRTYWTNVLARPR